MTRFFRSVSGREMVKILGKLGFIQVSQKGSHVKLKRSNASGTEIVIVPDHSELAPGTFRNILRMAGITLEEFDKVRKQ